VKLALVLVLAACAAPQRREVVQLPPQPAPGPWSELRIALDQCSAEQGVAGQLRVQIEVDPDGGAGQVSTDRADPALARCIGTSLGPTRFPRENRGHIIEVPVVVQ
jgi:hypothetical protein